MTETTKKISLNVPRVTFIEESHQYFIGKKELKGVTGTLIKKAFPDTYKNIPESVLKKAAERGGLVHNTFETFCSIFDASLEDQEKLKEEVAKADILVNGTLAGMKPHEDTTLITDKTMFRPDLVVADVVYNPEETRLLREAKEAGCRTVGGKGMLLWQGAAAYKLYIFDK